MIKRTSPLPKHKAPTAWFLAIGASFGVQRSRLLPLLSVSIPIALTKTFLMSQCAKSAGCPLSYRISCVLIWHSAAVRASFRPKSALPLMVAASLFLASIFGRQEDPVLLDLYRAMAASVRSNDDGREDPAHLNFDSAETQCRQAFKLLVEIQNADGSWGETESEWCTFLVIHALRNKGAF